MLLATCGSVNQLPINTSPSLYALTPDLVETVLEKIGIEFFLMSIPCTTHLCL